MNLIEELEAQVEQTGSEMIVLSRDIVLQIIAEYHHQGIELRDASGIIEEISRDLSPIQRIILRTLSRQKNGYVHSSRLMDITRSQSPEALQTSLSRLRKRLHVLAPHLRIYNNRGFGYSLDDASGVDN